MTHSEFEGLVRRLFEAMGMKSWNTWASKDDWVDAVAVRIQIIECEEIMYLCQEHLDLNVLISLPKPPSQRR